MSGARLIEQAGLPYRPALIEDAEGYSRRTRQGRRYGLIGGLVIGLLIPLGSESEISLALPLMFAGYLVGLLISEVLAPLRQDADHAVGRIVWRAENVLPQWAQLTVWMSFAPALASPLLALVHPVHGFIRITVPAYSYTCHAANLRLPGLPLLAASAAIGTAGLLVARVTLARLARRPLPADDADRIRLDIVMRCHTARVVFGGAAALALTLAGWISAAVLAAMPAVVCAAQPDSLPHRAYWWAPLLEPWLQWATPVLLGAAFITLAVCRYRLPAASWSSAPTG